VKKFIEQIYESEYSVEKESNILIEVFRMALKATMAKMEKQLLQLCVDLTKVERGNKAAAQRCRTGSIKLEKIAKLFRKESVQAEKKGQIKKKPVAKKKATKSKATTKKVVATKKKAAPKKAVATKKKAVANKKAAPKRKATARRPAARKKTTARRRAR